jgi:hypothetical protein
VLGQEPPVSGFWGEVALAPTSRAGRPLLYIRAYWGQQGILDGWWKPPVTRKVG